MNVRKAEIEDAEVIAQISVDTWQDAYKGIIDDSILSARKVDDKRILSWAENIQNPNFTVLVCEDSEILGYLWAGPARDEYGIKNEIYALYVKPIAQRYGAGSALIKAYKQIINEQSFYLYALQKNQKARCFYEKNGGAIYEKFSRNLNIQGQEYEEVCYVFGQE